jgi:hypothetical protein
MTVTSNDHDMSPITNMTEMFYGCDAITKVKFLADDGVIATNEEVVTSEINMTT